MKKSQKINSTPAKDFANISQDGKIIKSQFYQNKKSWINSLHAGISLNENHDPIPWLTYPAIEFLQKNIDKNTRIFEFGCGTSTLFFQKITNNLFSLETRKTWLEIVKKQLPKNHQNQIFLTIDPNEKSAETNEDYQNFPNKLAQETNEKFDVIIIDSTKRFECAKKAILAIKSDGIIVLDDSQRKNYKKIFNFFESQNFRKYDFIGISPGQITLKNTTIFFK